MKVSVKMMSVILSLLMGLSVKGEFWTKVLFFFYKKNTNLLNCNSFQTILKSTIFFKASTGLCLMKETTSIQILNFLFKRQFKNSNENIFLKDNLNMQLKIFFPKTTFD